MRRITEAAIFGDAPVLLSGESGTGKEVVAQLIHQLDRRPDKGAFITVDCTTIAKELAGSELFGHIRGAFTGAHHDREGAFALADGGTLFLDEIGDLPLPLQAELLRVLQERTFKAVGANVWRRTRFRLIAATHRSLEAEVAGGRFRDDLYYRIAGWRFTLPPLRDRLEDIPELTEFFLSAFANGRPAPSLRPEVTDFLMSHSYPGNVRQLRGILQRVMLRYPGSGEITLGLIAPEDRPTDPDHASADWLRDVEQAAGRAVACGVPLKEIGRHVGDCAVRVALRTEAGNLQRAAKRLGVTDRALQIRLASKREARLLAKVDEG
jgi:transcriptional regulator with PAS, ATPase and Fis domain